jgi:hypothetical protein
LRGVVNCPGSTFIALYKIIFIHWPEMISGFPNNGIYKENLI